MEKLACQEILSRAARLCSESEKCEKEIRDKLIQWEIADETADKIIEYLKKEKYIDEQRYAAFFVKDKHRLAKWGKTKIIYALKNKGIDPEIIHEAIANIDSDAYREQITSLLKSKFNNIKYHSLFDAKGKLYRYGMSKGFESETVLKAIECILKKEEL